MGGWDADQRLDTQAVVNRASRARAKGMLAQALYDKNHPHKVADGFSSCFEPSNAWSWKRSKTENYKPSNAAQKVHCWWETFKTQNPRCIPLTRSLYDEEYSRFGTGQTATPVTKRMVGSSSDRYFERIGFFLSENTCNPFL